MATSASDLYEALQEAHEIIEEQTRELERIGEQSLIGGIVLRSNDDQTTVLVGGQQRIMPTPASNVMFLSRGDSVVLTPDSIQIVRKNDAAIALGEIASVSRLIDDESLEVNVKGVETIAFCTEDLEDELKVGDKVLMDPSKTIVIMKLETPQSTYQRTADTGVSWDDIGGQEQAKQYLIEAIEMPLKHPKVFKFYNKKPIKGILLEGPPGCGKTMLAKAAATSVGGINSLFLYVKGPEILDPYVGVAEATLRSLFQQARQHKAETGIPAVLFIDEAESLFSSRDGQKSHMEKTLVPTFLAEMDGLDDSGAIVILATNNASSLDSAVTREGRMDRKVTITRPTQANTEEIFKLNLKKIPLEKESDIDNIAKEITESLFDQARKFYQVYFDDGSQAPFTLANLVSGSLIAGIVDHASSSALRRDIAGGKNPSGVKMEDLTMALDAVFHQNFNVNHTHPLQEFAGARGIIQIEKV